ncbi:efflux RND transporter permease subunit [Maritimibacter sp. DP1N21-5]|uniref:efflux RND transporter permease subunit n=1 Tax=Maritimibacter sp. DP1N21-5 TaxID=2836867 RepID=UPI001C454C96|nr:efflux RND transporter permease subunit [Maritimibacter sp. DP1N21-5]MBV7410763.1 efflux RND transporter permease subunit [Maritimibacter sp. DP1N21-5]
MFLTRISVSQPVFATMVMIAIMVVGVFSYSRLPVEQFPDVDFPVVAVVTSYPGATPEAVESDIIEPIEDNLSTLAGIDNITSTALTGSSLVLVQFDLEVESAAAVQDVRDRVSQVAPLLPDNANDPQILRFDPGELPIMSIGISSESLDEGALTQITEDVISKRIANLRGVGRASVVGGVPRQVQIEIDPDRQTALNVGIAEVAGAVAQENQDVPAGAVTGAGTSQSVQVEGRIETVRAFEDIIVARRAGQPIRLGDVATVSTGLAERESLAMLDGQVALAIDVVKTQGANTVDVAERVAEEVAKIQEDPEFSDIQVSILRDNSKPVVESFHSVQSMILEGGILATVIVFLFLNSWRSTVITGLTLPISIIGTMTAIYALGFTLNMMTLMALSLAVGILIDDAIVVRENIMRHLHMGKSHKQAALDGTNEIGLAVLATTLSIVSVFLPVAFMDGIIGRFFLQFGITVAVAVVISLFVSFTLDPMMSSVWYDPAADSSRKRGLLGRIVGKFDQFFEWIGVQYAKLLRKALKFRKTTLMAALGAFVGAFALFPMIGAEFVPPSDTGEVQVDLKAPVGTSLDRTAEKIAQVDALLRAEFPEIESTYATVNSGTTSGDNNATIIAVLVPSDERTRTPQELTSPMRQVLTAIPGAEFSVGASGGMGPVAPPIEIKIFGPDLRVLERLAHELSAEMQEIEGLVDVRTTLDDPQPTLGIEVDRDAAFDLGVSLSQVGDTLSSMLEGQTVSEWTSPRGESLDVVVRLPEWARQDPSYLGALPIAQSGAMGSQDLIRLDQVATITQSEGPGEINREDRERSVRVTANLESGVRPGDVGAAVQAAAADLDYPLGYSQGTGGEVEDMQDLMLAAGAALALAVIFIYLVLASQFGSFMQPFAIMSSLPLALIGVLGGLLVFDSTLNVMSIIGFIMLMGLVTKNAILLVDNANQHMRDDGLNLYDALVNAGRTRFRPIVMTTLAMIFGMLPLALNIHGGTGQNASMAHAVIGGLISSSLLTLVVVPVILTYTEGFGRFVSRFTPKAPDDMHHEGAPAE